MHFPRKQPHSTPTAQETATVIIRSHVPNREILIQSYDSNTECPPCGPPVRGQQAISGMDP